MTDPTIKLACDLIEKKSLTPNDAGCHALLDQLFSNAGFDVLHFEFDGVTNLVAKHGTGHPTICFNGHSDVVPPGPKEAWKTDPFTPTIVDEVLYGRGAADMKGALASMAIASINFVKENPNHPGTILFTCTSDEEGAGIHGTKALLKSLIESGQSINCALIAEPTCTDQFGDKIKVGRRGSVSCYLKVFGKQGHVAYPHLARNPIHQIAPFLTELSQIKWDEGTEFFQPTSLQIANLNAGTGANNVIPGELTLDFNLRNSPATSSESIVNQVEELIKKHNLKSESRWETTAKPFENIDLSYAHSLKNIIQKHTNIEPKFDTGGGTSDARFFAEYNIPTLEFGPINKTIHAPNECVALAELTLLTQILQDWLAKQLHA